MNRSVVRVLIELLLEDPSLAAQAEDRLRRSARPELILNACRAGYLEALRCPERPREAVGGVIPPKGGLRQLRGA